jgi:hypothetical protein
MVLSHGSAPSPSSLFVVVAVALIHRLRPHWLAIGVTEAAQAECLNPERISRLATRVMGLWQAILDPLSHQGRPTRKPDPSDEVGLLRSLLTIATTLLGQVNLGRPALRALVVGAWLRLRTEAPQLSQEQFCETLALPTRTLRSWLQNAPRDDLPRSIPVPSALPSTKRSRAPKPRKPRRRRFGFDLVIADTQIGADTTDLSVLDVPLKLVAAQDIGGRDDSLFDKLIIDDHENADHVIKVLAAAIDGREGMQIITDQGTPYMAKATRDALDQLGVEHAPQKEGNPTGKATVERGFGILKTIAAPLLALSDRAAKVMPALRDPELAKELGHLVMTALLRAYQAGSRAARSAVDQRNGLDEGALRRIAEQSRQDARADNDSRRLLLGHWHEIYCFELPLAKFLREYCRYPLPVLKAAEKQLRSQLHRPDIRVLTRYFGAIVRSEMDAYRSSKTRRDRFEQRAEAVRVADATHKTAQQARAADPVAWLREALGAMVYQWQPREQQLLFGGVGAALGWIQNALRGIARLHGTDTLADIAGGVMNDCAQANSARLGQPGVDAIRQLLQRELQALTPQNQNPACQNHQPLGTLWNTGRTKRPPAPNPLSI